MEKSLKSSSQRKKQSNSRRSFSTFKKTAAGASLVAVFFCGVLASAQKPKPTASPAPVAAKPAKEVETFTDIITKAQNLTLQRDRLQASQILLRAIQREPKNSVAYREMMKALEELTAVFYTERAQGAFAAAESIVAIKPKEALDSYAEALRLEETNVAVLKGIARANLVLDECDKAETSLKTAESLIPFSGEIHLLRLQVH
ncbi:MAG: hypothetical protein V4692_16475, partial [Bdellovibrionota bacterium]